MPPPFFPVPSPAPHQLDLPVPSMHRDALRLLSGSVDRLTSGSDREGIAVLWHSMLYAFLQVEADAQAFKAQAAIGASDAPQARDIVSTPYGLGVVETVRPPLGGHGACVYEVMLPWGRAVLQAEALKAVPGTGPSSGESSGSSTEGSPDLPPFTLYCSSAGHLFFRLYHILVVRVGLAVCRGPQCMPPLRAPFPSEVEEGTMAPP
jgi:hypothetical protein